MRTDASLGAELSTRSTIRTVNDVDLHVVTGGDHDDPLVVLLHGFPDFWHGWRHQIEPLIDAGYRVVVPDQRGYNLSDVPTDLDSYRISSLSSDVRELIHWEGRESAHVIGHDWGAMVAWDLALRHPDVVDHLGIVNVPHPSAFQQALRADPEQLKRSWYAAFFQLPRLPEWALARDDFRMLEEALRESGSADAFSEDDIRHYRRSWREVGSLTGMLNWYRAAARRPDVPPRERVEQPTLIVWGDEDTALIPDLAPMSRQFCPNGRVERFPDRSHWVHMEAHTEVTDLLLDHLDG